MEKPEYRIYVSEQGDEPVARDVLGEDELKKVLVKTRKTYPKATIVVKEVLETVLEVHLPNGISIE